MLKGSDKINSDRAGLVQKATLEPTGSSEANQLMETYKEKYQEIFNIPYKAKQADYDKLYTLIEQYGLSRTDNILVTFIQQYKSKYSSNKFPYPTVNMINDRIAKEALHRYNEIHRWDNVENSPKDFDW